MPERRLESGKEGGAQGLCPAINVPTIKYR